MKIFFYLIIFFFSFQAYAVSFKSRYEAQGMNMVLLSADIDTVLTNDTYYIETKAKSKGILSLFIHPETIFQTQGRKTKSGLKVIDSVMKIKSGKEIEVIRQNFDKKTDFIDYQSVLVYLMKLSVPSNQKLFVSDGKRDMQVDVMYQGKQVLSDVHQDLTGEADAYSVRIKILSGKKKGWFFKRMQEEKKSPLWLYMKKNEKTGQNELVLSTFDTGILGRLYIIQKETEYEKN
ncbi:MAG: hypothetical protein IJY58_02010 [Alphaproteobacteria bacterium]|nr:hypothetical protein [Alphaproteobacteria bacterium]